MDAEQRRDIALVIADVDGTLVTADKVLTPRARRAVAALRGAGIAFAITSGRPPRGMAMLIEQLDLDTPIAGFNGGLLVTRAMATIEEHLLAPAVARNAVALICEAGLDAWVYSGHDWLVRDAAAPHVAHEQETVAFAPTIVEDFGPALDRAAKIVGVSDDRDRIARCARAAHDRLGARALAVCSQPYYLDVTHPDANKGAVVAALSRHLAIAPARIATIGDMPNDVLMFRRSGLSIAMGNAAPQVKAEARHVTASHEDEGFAAAMERFILGRRPPRAIA
jgi:Cof subfamily protein (haloacid dehalogenase superfamily)